MITMETRVITRLVTNLQGRKRRFKLTLRRYHGLEGSWYADARQLEPLNRFEFGLEPVKFPKRRARWAKRREVMAASSRIVEKYGPVFKLLAET